MSLESKFWTYHKANPQVFNLFKHFANEARSKGYAQYSAKAIFERVRWEVSVNTNDPEKFKMNNNYTSRYARLLITSDPSFADFFRNREMKTHTIL